MAVKRVVLQHFSMNMDLVPREEPDSDGTWGSSEGEGGSDRMFGLSPPSESRLMQRRLQAASVPAVISSPSC